MSALLPSYNYFTWNGQAYPWKLQVGKIVKYHLLEVLEGNGLESRFLFLFFCWPCYFLESDLYHWLQTVIPKEDWPCLAFRPLLLLHFWNKYALANILYARNPENRYWLQTTKIRDLFVIAQSPKLLGFCFVF